MSGKTVFFKNCLGAFQGGGCRAAAFVGAYTEAAQRGVTFSSLVGTSAGAIVATLIAAGASPKQLEEIIRRLDFQQFLREAPRLDSAPKWTRGLSLLTKKAVLLERLGIYSSAYVEEFVEEELKKLLPRSHSPVQFRDLPKSLAVVATDLRSRSVKVWSTAETPSDEVAFAVRASCSIPLFFQPAQSRYVDGGVLSNLPSFVFSGSQEHSDRVLAFCLKADDDRQFQIGSVSELARALADTIIEGSQDLQLKLQQHVHVITIDSGKVRATDFSLMNPALVSTLERNGQAATAAFFEDETLKVRGPGSSDGVCASYMQSYKAVAQTVAMPVKDVTICETTTDWVYKLFPSVLNWKLQGAPVSVLLKENTDDNKHGLFRQRLLTAMGCKVEQVNDLPFRGFLFNAKDQDTALAVVRSERTKESKNYDGVVYAGRPDYTVLSLLRRTVSTRIGHESRPGPTLVEGDPTAIVKLLRAGVHQYAVPAVRISFEAIKVADLSTVTRFVTGFKYTQVDKMFEFYKSAGLDWFVPAKLRYHDGRETFVMPPVVEVHGSKNLVIEGTTRCTYSRRNGFDELIVCLVTGVRAPLPSSSTYSLDETVISDEDREGATRYEGFSLEHFRSIERAVRDPQTTLL